MTSPALIALLLAPCCVLHDAPLRARALTPRAAAMPQQAGTTPLPAAMADFRKRVDAYLALRAALTKTIPEVKETGNPAKINAREQQLGQAIAAARKTAKAGDVVGPALAPHLLEALASDWRSRSESDRRALFNEVPPGLELKVNQPYPSNLPFVSVPGNLLARLPMLPEVLEWRLMDRRLLLRDRDANVIIDVLVGVLPKR